MSITSIATIMALCLPVACVSVLLLLAFLFSDCVHAQHACALKCALSRHSEHVNAAYVATQLALTVQWHSNTATHHETPCTRRGGAEASFSRRAAAPIRLQGKRAKPLT